MRNGSPNLKSEYSLSFNAMDRMPFSSYFVQVFARFFLIRPHENVSVNVFDILFFLYFIFYLISELFENRDVNCIPNA